MTSLTRALSCKQDRDTGVLDDWFYLWHPTSLRRPADSGKGPQHGLHLGISLQGPTKAVFCRDTEVPRQKLRRSQLVCQFVCVIKVQVFRAVEYIKRRSGRHMIVKKITHKVISNIRSE